MNDDAVLVEHPDRKGMETNATVGCTTRDSEDKRPESRAVGPVALQIVSIGTEEDAYAFTFEEENLNTVLSKVPSGWKVAVISVVGAFRTGKSFLLSWFLRYLHHVGEKKVESPTKKWYEEFDTLGNDGFDWRGGAERNTTGIWIWSEPHFVQKKDGQQIAILLVDTQGMFDHETTMALTASIFGLSTLLSSYQIYNVDKRIQEDNLQQLALFSEYARMAMTMDTDKGQPSTTTTVKPFQKIEFLVRDWQNFEEEEDYALMEKEMDEYLKKVIAERDAKDLQETREQILTCFQNISAYGLVHPGVAVTKKKYTGEFSSMDRTFLNLMDRYCKKVFDVETVQPKIIHGRELSAVELGSYVKAYAAMFTSGANFPEAATLLDATASANNTNAVHLSMSEYKDMMDRVAGPRCSNYVKTDELIDLHNEALDQGLALFESMATFGNQRSIEDAREKFHHQVDESFVIYTSLNEGRNPLAGLETYLLPLTIALVSYILRVVADSTCSSWSNVCRRSSDAFSHLYAVVLCFMFILAATKAQQIKGLVQRIKSALELIMSSNDGGKAKRD